MDDLLIAHPPQDHPPRDYGISTADAVPALISFFDADHICRFANDHHIDWYGRGPGELVGLHMRDFLGEEAYASRRPYLERVAAGQSISFEAEVPHWSGNWREAAIRYVPRMGAQGFEGFHILVFDLSREQHRFHSVFDGTVVGFLEIDLTPVRALVAELEGGVDDLRAHIAGDLSVVRRALEITPIVGLNEKASQMLGASPREAIGTRLGRWCPDASLGAWNNIFLHYLARAVSYEEETVISRSDDSLLDIILSAAFPKRPEEQVLVVVGLVDISERVAKEQALARMQAELVHAARVSMLGEMVASIAHEVNQPLSAVVANGHAALRWLNRPMPEVEEAKSAIRRMVAEGQRASEIIASTRRMAVKSAGERASFALHEMILEAVSITRRQIANLGATLSTDLACPSVTMTGDRIQLQQVLINLIVNAAQAMEHQPAGTRNIAVTAQRLETGIAIAVVDTGPGLGDIDADQLFEAFFTTKKDGMGMGLSVSKSIVEAHGGSIRALPGAEGGTMFRVELPIA